jgi:hypothetical protein
LLTVLNACKKKSADPETGTHFAAARSKEKGAIEDKLYVGTGKSSPNSVRVKNESKLK